MNLTFKNGIHAYILRAKKRDCVRNACSEGQLVRHAGEVLTALAFSMEAEKP
jgi:hypothetical protein